MSVNKENSSESGSLHEFEVRFDGSDDDIEDALRLSETRKWLIVILISLGSVCITSISSVWALASRHIMRKFHISHEVSTLGISFYIWGLGTGGIFLSPISEFHGRKIVYTLGLFVVFAFQFVPAFSNNIGSILFSRFISGFFGASFLSVASGTFSDLFRKTERNSKGRPDQTKALNKALVMYSASPFIGPGLGPLISGFVNEHLNFRWTFYIMAIWSGVVMVAVIFFIPETYEPVLLKKKAIRLRKTTGDDRWFAPIELNKASIYESIILSSKRPILLIFRDNMTLALCFYSGFVLAIVYMFFVSFPYIFESVYGFSLQDQGLSFVGLILGLGITAFVSPPIFDHILEKLTKKNGYYCTEYRFLPLIVGVFIIPIGLFIIAWTSYPQCHWIAPIVGSFFYGMGTILVFNGIFSYTVEAYRKYTASAMATNSFVRSAMSGVFPLFTLQMYKKMNIHWATTLLAFLGCLLIPIPFIFYKYGAELRRKSPYTWSE
ncbi:putative drug proton antiporter [Clavispora lusitaniae]|uniref:Drug proton antiporter n=1 Tax=Clavispora lusitaniae TaxID=36911 RepID=A0ACD0WMC6_CLALS|nr:putative drug proton antiporter [Clavispora lusitaniae]QFZ34345.1 putative drug proton antiporter [Clavispora lusitaniae]QFZ40029.1 putative drug proton antiporter [Clavispora lusitaniae]QFZ45711.1 putative drug proton antiporter [Clavispora lusitaniae]QFZ51375.1 putative drug proton antiporter [Clavispora lusitaniae]